MEEQRESKSFDGSIYRDTMIISLRGLVYVDTYMWSICGDILHILIPKRISICRMSRDSSENPF